MRVSYIHTMLVLAALQCLTPKSRDGVCVSKYQPSHPLMTKYQFSCIFPSNEKTYNYDHEQHLNTALQQRAPPCITALQSLSRRTKQNSWRPTAVLVVHNYSEVRSGGWPP